MGNIGWEGLKCADCSAPPTNGTRRCNSCAVRHRERERKRDRKKAVSAKRRREWERARSRRRREEARFGGRGKRLLGGLGTDE